MRLQENQQQLTSDLCRKEVFSFSVLEAQDPLGMDVPLAHACAPDLQRLCPAVGGDHSRKLSCLRGMRDRLSEECKKEEMRFSMMEVREGRGMEEGKRRGRGGSGGREEGRGGGEGCGDRSM